MCFTCALDVYHMYIYNMNMYRNMQIVCVYYYDYRYYICIHIILHSRTCILYVIILRILFICMVYVCYMSFYPLSVIIEELAIAPFWVKLHQLPSLGSVPLLVTTQLFVLRG